MKRITKTMKPVGPEARKEAARLWTENASMGTQAIPVRGKVARALAVILFCQETRDYLATHDPASLRQAQQAINGTDYTTYLSMVSNATKKQD